MSSGQGNWLSRMRAGLQRSTDKIVGGLGDILTKHKLDAEALQRLEDLLIEADLGPQTAANLVKEISNARFSVPVEETVVQTAMAEHIARLLEPYAKPLMVDPTKRPFVVLVIGVNGSGKTTTIGKLAQHYRNERRQVTLVAGDTFRAAAISQLKIWGERTHSTVIAGEPGADAAALAYKGLETAQHNGTDILLIDTAGRLHNRDDLMQSLAKVVRVIKKLDASAPHATLLVLDATIGQNAHPQVEAFKNLTPVTGLIVTKLDGSAKGGVLVALADRFGLPIQAIGVGEGVDDLQPFNAQDYARSLFGLEK